MKLKSALCCSVFICLTLSACDSQLPETLTAGKETALPPTLVVPTEADPTSLPETEAPDPAVLPSGVLSMGKGTEGVRLTSLEGEVIDEFQFPGFSLSGPSPDSSSRFHYGGTTQMGVVTSPCIFMTSISGDQSIAVHESKSPVINLQQLKGLIHLIGASGQPIIVFAAYDPENLNEFNNSRFSPSTEDESEPTRVPPVVNSWLYTASYKASPASDLLLTRSDENGYGIYPLSLHMEGDVLKGVWYTLSYRGLFGGGPIVYTGFRGLYYLGAETNQEHEALAVDQPFLGLSSSQRLIAYTIAGDGSEKTIIIEGLGAGKLREIPILPGTHPTGTGTALFSPLDTTLAWQEHYLGEEGVGIVFRFASTQKDGKLIEIDSHDLISGTADPEVYHVRLAGWMDDQRIVFEAHGPEIVDLYILDMGNMSVSYLAPGAFIGFTYS